MAYLSEKEVHSSYTDASDEADQWRINYPEIERLMDNGLMDDLDENLPEVNDGSLAASLFKLSKRVIKKKLSGQAIPLDHEAPWMLELANFYWTKKILPNAKSKASPRRKWKDAVRKAAGYGGQPIITLFVSRGNYEGADFIVPYAQDVKLEAGKDSDEDSDVIFWDVYYSKLQLENMIEAAEEEIANGDSKPIKRAVPGDKTDSEEKDDKYYPIDDSTYQQEEGKPDPTNYYDIEHLKAILQIEPEEQRPGNQQSRAESNTAHKKTGYHFYIAFQRGVDAPFMMVHASTEKCVREWSNPDPTGDVPVHYLYCYQDFLNPYGIGIVKLAGGTQNILDYMRQADVLATQLGIRPPKKIKGDEDEVDEESMVYAQDANWYIGNAEVEPVEMANGVYNELPTRMAMYQTSLQKFIPIGDNTIGAGQSGDPQVSKVPASIKLQAQNLSIDDEDFSENVEECYAAVSKSMINTQFANMEGSDLLKLDKDEIDKLMKAGFPGLEDGVQEIEIVWDNVRSTFDFEIDPDSNKTDDDEKALEGRLKAYELIQKDPTLNADLAKDNKRLNKGELIGDIMSALTDSDKILVDIDDQEAQQIIQEEQAKAQAEADASKPAEQPKQLSDSIAWKPADLREGERTQVLAQVGVQADQQNPSLAEDQQAHGQAMDVTNAKTAAVSAAAKTPAGAEKTPKAPAAKTPAKGDSQTAKQLAQAHEHIKQVMKAYNVDPHTAAAMLEAERQGYEPKEILAAYKRSKSPVPATAGAK